MATDSENIKSTLRQWASQQQLTEASLSADGQSLSLQDTTLPNAVVTVEHAGKSCQYSLASIYLQILDPNQGLMPYRNACKQYAVRDPVKPLDKPVVVGYFLGSSAVGESAVAPTETAAEEKARQVKDEEAAARAKAKAKERKKSRHHHERKEASPSKRRDKSRTEEESAVKKKKPKQMVTNEMLFEHLNVVVDKRRSDDRQSSKEEIRKALSSEGFEVTPNLLEEYKERTQMILANEIPVGDSASILRANNPRKDLSRVLELYMETVNPSKTSGSSSKSSSKNRAVTAPKKVFKSYLVGKKPVIIVPKGMTAPLTLINAHEFLGNARFVPRDVMIKQGGRQRTPVTTFTRNIKTRAGTTAMLEYEILDNPRKLGPNLKEWERIVAVIVLGQDWQFKDWEKGYKTPVDLFHKAYGFFVSMEGDKIPAEVGGWAVHKAKLNRDRRGLDSVTHASFWNGLDEWMAVHKPELLPQADS